jgi:hypothetical protein
LAELAIRALCDRRSISLDAERLLARMFADTLCELEFAAIAERMIASGPSTITMKYFSAAIHATHACVLIRGRELDNQL